MPPQRRNPEGVLGRRLTEEIERLKQTHNMSYAEAEYIALQPIRWMERMQAGEDPDGITQEAMVEIAGYQEQYGRSQDWDEPRAAVAEALIVCGHFDDAAKMLLDSYDLAHTLEECSVFLARLVKMGGLTVVEAVGFNDLVAETFVAAARGQEFEEVGEKMMLQYLARADSPPVPELTTPDEWLSEAGRRRLDRASWGDIQTIMDQTQDWPEQSDDTMRKEVVSMFARHQHNILTDPKSARKEVETLKDYLEQQEQVAPAPVWDKFRFTAAMSFFDANAPNYGRGIAREMTDPEMHAMVSFALIETGRDREALQVAQEIASPQVFAKVLHVGEWADRAFTDAMIEDITHVTIRNVLKYDPAMRVAVAKGLVDLFIAQHAVASREGDTQKMAQLQTAMADMQARANLLLIQKQNRYIRAPKKK